MKATQVIQNQKGFTLIELMVVAVILAIISAIAVPLYSSYKKEAYAQEAYQTLGQIADTCVLKASKAIETGSTTVGTVNMPTAKYFTYSGTCAITGGAFLATGGKVTGTLATTDTLTLTLAMGGAGSTPTKTFTGAGDLSM